MNLRHTLLAVLMIVSLTSCNRVLLGIYGIKKPKHQTDEQIIKYAHKHNYDKYSIYKINNNYRSFIDTVGKNINAGEYKLKTLQKQYYQPLQYLLFDSTGSLIVHSVNCDMGGNMINLQWNAEGQFDVFPPIPQSTVYKHFKLGELQKHITQLNNTTVNNNETYSYTCVVFWNILMGRHSRRLVNLALQNLKLANGAKVNVILINNDNLYYK